MFFGGDATLSPDALLGVLLAPLFPPELALEMDRRWFAADTDRRCRGDADDSLRLCRGVKELVLRSKLPVRASDLGLMGEAEAGVLLLDLALAGLDLEGEL